jgi:hypothetical protein
VDIAACEDKDDMETKSATSGMEIDGDITPYSGTTTNGKNNQEVDSGTTTKDENNQEVDMVTGEEPMITTTQQAHSTFPGR